MSKSKLKNAPLIEVIFELHWHDTADANGSTTDEGFDLAQGKFAEKIKSEFPLHKKLIPEGFPIRIFGAPLHQYRKNELEWPVIQHGQGVFSVNETENGYEWQKTFRPTIIESVKKLLDSYEEPLKFNRVKLQYIDAWDIKKTNPKDFMKENLQTDIQTNFEISGKLNNFSVFQAFELEDGSEAQLNISSGINNKNQEQAVIWTTSVEKISEFKLPDIIAWLDNAHDVTSKLFVQMLNPKFYASLD